MKANNLLVVVDMQEDFVNGPLGSEQAREIVPGIRDLITSFDGTVCFTYDTHGSDYLSTQEGGNLPVTHCQYGSPGWYLVPELKRLTNRKTQYLKRGFGSSQLYEHLRNHHYDSITFVGVCTGICVISNAVLAKTADPESEIIIRKDLCACVTKESHETALEAMKLLQMTIR